MAADAFKLHKRLAPDAEDLVLRANVREKDGANFYPLTFTRERIDYVTQVEEGLSGIALKNGTKITVAMGYEELEQKIYFADIANAPLLDLRGVTGAAVKQTPVPGLTEEFKAAAAPKAEGKKPMLNKEIKIAVFVRQAHEQNFQQFIFMDTSIDWSGVTATKALNGEAVELPLRFGSGPFGDDSLLIDMSRDAFMEIYNKAKMDGVEELDLREQTRRRDPARKPPKPFDDYFG